MSVFTDVDTNPESGEPHFVHLLAEQTVRQHPDAIAIEAQGQQITYRELDERTEVLCQAILHTDPDSLQIGISTTRTVEMVIGVMAILRAGKAYLPLDPAYPPQRLEQIISDSGMRSCLTTGRDKALFSSLPITLIESDQPPRYPDQLVPVQGSRAFVLYTSGSTGKPKGVCMGHAPLLNLLHWQIRESVAGFGTRTLQFSPLSFDPSFLEFLATFATGGTLVLITEEQRLDLDSLLVFIDEQRINRLFLPFVALQYLAEAAIRQQRFPHALQEVMTAGEQLKITPQVEQFFTALPDCVLFNQYGPTECHVVTQLRLEGHPSTWPRLPSIGKLIDNTTMYVVDEQLNVLPDGEVGELCFGGVCVAEGYLNRPDLTREKFIQLSVPGPAGPESVRIYRTGDLGRLLPDGVNVDFLGRRDDQVKIRGYRVELGEVEVVLNHCPGVKQAVVIAREGSNGQKRLLAYLIAAGVPDTPAVRQAVEQQLPDFMMPSAFVWLDDFPKTTSGKVDRKLLPDPDRKRPELGVAYRKPKTGLEQTMARIWSELLQIDAVGVDDNFFDLGGNSLLAQRSVAALGQAGLPMPITKLYQFPTIAGLVQYLQPNAAPVAEQPTARKKPQADIAVIGMAGRFPGADTIDALWEVLTAGRETIRFFSDAELDASLPPALTRDPLYVKARGIVEGVDEFDPLFFGLTPALAQLMDPQQRLFLEIAWEALEQTGYLPQRYSGRVGVFAGCGNNTYYLNNVQGQRQLIDRVGAFQVSTVNEKDYIASRTAYQLNLKGPAVSVYSACSTSLLAVAQAVQSIRSGQCELALAGGASVTTPVRSGHLYQDGAMLSADGHCRSFDADARGTVFSDGAGVVLLKEAEAARRDGDTIYGLIRGVGVNNDGGGKAGFSAPSADGQAGAIRMALDDAGVAPATISYVEAHGTATPLGDPIEIEGLTMAFGEQAHHQYCALGSIKSNMGHLTQAAGVAGLIKTLLGLHHRQLLPSLGFERPNPAINFVDSPFFVNTRLADWPSPASGQPRRAGVSSFGVGGTNVHVIVEEAHRTPESEPSVSARPAQLLTWSAKTAMSRDAYAERLADWLKANPAVALADVAYTLQTTRADFRFRRFAVVDTDTDPATEMSAPAAGASSETVPDDVVFLFPGQGAQSLNMGRALYENEPVYRDAVDRCTALLQTRLGLDIRSVIYPDRADAEAEQRLRNTRYTQPALFVVEYALAQLWMSWGIRPTILCGHSVGEFVAAQLAGIFTLEDALMLIATRGQLVSEQPTGSMLSVRLGADAVRAMLPDTLSVAAVNSRSLCVVAGPDEHIADFARLLDGQDVPNRLLLTSHAFHSAMMDPIVETFAEVVAGVTRQRPTTPIVSTLTGTWLTDEQATDAQYWGDHLRQTVRFADALDTLAALDNPLLFDIGPGQTSATLARQQLTGKSMPVIAAWPGNGDWPSTNRALLTTLGNLYLAGLTPAWIALYADQSRRRLRLPGYAFDRQRCWVDPVATTEAPAMPTNSASEVASSDHPQPIHVMNRTTVLIQRIRDLLDDASGIDMTDLEPNQNFLELGFDSLLLTQVAITLKNEFGVPLTFRQLTGQYDTAAKLADYLDQVLPAEAFRPAQPAPAPATVLAPAPVAAPVAVPASMPMADSQPLVAGSDTALGLIAQQLQLLGRQIALLQGGGVPVAAPVTATVAAPAPVAPVPTPVAAPQPVRTVSPAADLTPEEVAEHKKPFGATARIDRQATGLSAAQASFLRELTDRYTRKTSRSKAYAQQHRAQMADPRVVSGFRPLTKEIVYPLVVNRSRGSHLWDIDGNEYIDALNGFGSNMFGYQPDWIRETLHEQIDAGYEVGPQHYLAGEVSRLVCELTGSDRAALCNTGSEAVLGAMRVARTVTGRSLIVAFSGSYHGIVDEVLVRGSKKLKSFPAAPGIMPESVQNMLILDYGTDETLRIIRERAHELAAVLVEPVQSRRPEFVPIEFLKAVRAITETSGTALIFDEVITGFRSHPGGTQALFGIRADMATYGKVVGAGLPIGVIAGKRAFMDALDGGHWQYGDDSVPEVGVTYFAGTFVRHPLALAAARASLLYMREQGPALQQELTRKTEKLARAVNRFLEERQLPMFVAHFASLWKLKFTEEVPYGELIFTLMREKGIHIWDGFPCFTTEAHTDDEINSIVSAFIDSINELTEAGFLLDSPTLPVQDQAKALPADGTEPPVTGARLGRDPAGNPAWFVPNPDRPGTYLQVDLIP